MRCIGRGFGLLNWRLLRSKGFLPAALWVLSVLLFLVCWPFLVLLLVYLRCTLFVRSPALASPCILIGLLVLPLCGAALTFFAAAKKVSKESGSHRQPVGVHLGGEPALVRDEIWSRAAHVSDKGLIHPTPHCVRRGSVCKGNRAMRESCTPAELAERVMPDGGARSATLERMTALSLTRVVRETVSSRTAPAGVPRWTPTGWRCEPLSLLTFFAAAKKVSAAPHRGNANKPIRIQGKANAVRQAAQGQRQ